MKQFELGRLRAQEFTPSNGEQVICHVLFTHANGVACATYSHFLQRVADAWKARVICYDIRGMGSSSIVPGPAYSDGKYAIWKHLVKDLEDYFHALAHHFDVLPANWIFVGHSLGGWLSLQSAAHCHVKNVWLLDIPILSTPTSFLWTLACIFNKRSEHTLARVARRRKEYYRNHEQAFRAFRKTPFFKDWPDEKIELYISANYSEQNERLHLRHSPGWEADIFEAMPANAGSAFLQIPKRVRRSLEVTCVVGQQSDVCNPRAGHYVRLFFPKLRWAELAGAGHMFPFTHEDALVRLMSDSFNFTGKVEAKGEGPKKSHSHPH